MSNSSIRNRIIGRPLLYAILWSIPIVFTYNFRLDSRTYLGDDFNGHPVYGTQSEIAEEADRIKRSGRSLSPAAVEFALSKLCEDLTLPEIETMIKQKLLRLYIQKEEHENNDEQASLSVLHKWAIVVLLVICILLFFPIFIDREYNRLFPDKEKPGRKEAIRVYVSFLGCIVGLSLIISIDLTGWDFTEYNKVFDWVGNLPLVGAFAVYAKNTANLIFVMNESS